MTRNGKVHLCNKYFTKEKQRILVYEKASKSNVGSIFSRILYIFFEERFKYLFKRSVTICEMKRVDF